MRLTQSFVEEVLGSFTPEQLASLNPMREIFAGLDNKSAATLANLGIAGIYNGLSAEQMRGINEVMRSHRQLLLLAANYRPMTRPDDPYEDALDVQKARRALRIVRDED